MADLHSVPLAVSIPRAFSHPASVTSTGALPASISVLSEMRSDDEVEAVACKIGAVDKFDFTLRHP